jgi:hypothetical protein
VTSDRPGPASSGSSPEVVIVPNRASPRDHVLSTCALPSAVDANRGLRAVDPAGPSRRDLLQDLAGRPGL